MKKISFGKIELKKIQYIFLFVYIVAISAFQLDTLFDKVIVIGSFFGFVICTILKKEKIRLNKEILWIILFWLYYYTSIIWCNNANDLLMLVKPSIQVVLLSVCLPSIIDDKNDINKILNYIVISLFVTSLLIFIRTPISYFGISRIGDVTGLHVNTIGIRMATGALLCLYFMRNKEISKKKKIIYLILFVLFIAMAFFTGSRKAVIILFLGVILYELYVSKGIGFVFKVIAVVAFVTLLYRLLMSNEMFQDVIGKRMQTFIETITGSDNTDYSYLERQFYIERAKELFSEYTAFGYGGNNFMSYMRNIGFHHVAYSHNNFYELLSTLGIVGFIIYYYMWVKTIINLFKKYNTEKHPVTLILLVITGINLIMDYGHVCYYSDFNILLLILAYLVSIEKKKKTGETDYENTNRSGFSSNSN